MRSVLRLRKQFLLEFFQANTIADPRALSSSNALAAHDGRMRFAQHRSAESPSTDARSLSNGKHELHAPRVLHAPTQTPADGVCRAHATGTIIEPIAETLLDTHQAFALRVSRTGSRLRAVQRNEARGAIRRR